MTGVHCVFKKSKKNPIVFLCTLNLTNKLKKCRPMNNCKVYFTFYITIYYCIYSSTVSNVHQHLFFFFEVQTLNLKIRFQVFWYENFNLFKHSTDHNGQADLLFFLSFKKHTHKNLHNHFEKAWRIDFWPVFDLNKYILNWYYDHIIFLLRYIHLLSWHFQ